MDGILQLWTEVDHEVRAVLLPAMNSIDKRELYLSGPNCVPTSFLSGWVSPRNTSS